jgi:hypothetical protein
VSIRENIEERSSLSMSATMSRSSGAMLEKFPGALDMVLLRARGCSVFDNVNLDSDDSIPSSARSCRSASGSGIGFSIAAEGGRW